MFFIKMTFLFQYYRVFRHIHAMKITYLVTIFLIGGWCLGQFLAVVFVCIPVQGFWDASINAKCQNQLVGVYLNAVGTLVTDFIILLLPIPAIWKLNLPRTQKWALLGIFGIGGFTSAISIVRVTTLGDPNEGGDLTYNTVTSSCWSVAELSSGVITAALATVRPLVGRFMPAFASRYNSGLKPYQRYGDGPPTTGTGKRTLSKGAALGNVPRNETRALPSISDTDLFYTDGFELQGSSTERTDSEPRKNTDQGMLADGTPRSASFNVALEDDEAGLTQLGRSESRRSSRYCYYESSSRDSEVDLGLWSGTQTKVTGGLPALPRLSGEENRAMKPRGLAIRVDRDWEVRETYA
ncbi:hypothetical protein F5Y19DRAFT_220073 [Xylariaceae sp. FL1651]|nr:hypothetical protein F5Y19DRAFT_220073 [Xylariaceae sp. FL1651]